MRGAGTGFAPERTGGTAVGKDGEQDFSSASANVSELREITAALRAAVRGERDVLSAGAYPLYSQHLLKGQYTSRFGMLDTAKKGRTTVFVHDPQEGYQPEVGVEHSYIIAETPSTYYFVAAPASRFTARELADEVRGVFGPEFVLLSTGLLRPSPVDPTTFPPFGSYGLDACGRIGAVRNDLAMEAFPAAIKSSLETRAGANVPQASTLAAEQA